MRQITQSLANGEISIGNYPVPNLVQGNLLIKTKFSLISAGTERMLLDFGKSNLIEKTLQQPEKVKQTLEKAIIDGFF